VIMIFGPPAAVRHGSRRRGKHYSCLSRSLQTNGCTARLARWSAIGEQELNVAQPTIAVGIGTVPYTVRTVQIRAINCGFRALTGRLRYGSRRRNNPYDCVYGRRQRWLRKVSEIQNSGFHLFLPPRVCLQPLFPSYQPGW
jgi:hypothetical protein